MKPAENLQKAVLQAAMQGKLTRQLKTDSSVDDLLQKIAEEKARLIKEGKIKKESGGSLPLAPERKRSSATPSPRGTPPKTPDNSPQVLEENSISSRQRNARFEPIPQEEIPFEIPENWRWVKVGNVLSIARGGSPRPITSYLTTSDDGYNWIKIGDSEIGGKYINKTAEKIIKEGLYKTRLVHKGDLLLSNSMSFGRPYILNIDGCIHDGWLVLHDYSESLNKEFLYFVFSSNVLKEQFFGKVSGAVVKNLNSDKVADTIIPLPPIEEQQRIVEKLNSILPLIDEYGKEEDELVALSQNFPEDIKKSVLQSAMQGKLTRQQQTDSSVDDLLKKIAEEKARLIAEGKIKKDTTKAGASARALAEITQEEIPFEIPENWRWVRLQNISTYGQPKKKKSASELTDSDWVLDLEDIERDTGRILNKASIKTRQISGEKVVFDKNDILYSKLRPYLKKNLVAPECGVCTSEIVPFKTFGNIYNEFINQYLKSPFVDSYINSVTYGMKMPRVGTDTMLNLPIPLPPIEEQQRIVEKLNQILPIIDSMAVYGTKKKSGRPKQEEALSFIRTFLQAKKTAQPKTAAPEILELKAKAKQELPAAVQKYAGLMGVTYNRITIRHQKTRWGSCTKNGNLNFNCLIMKMPDQVRDYVIIHELAHRKELNHSSKYWAIVAEYCPWYKKAKQWLKDNGQELMER